MRCVFRVDASVKMGIGHLTRCLTLAEALRERGVQIRFICREHRGNLISLLQQKDVPVTVLSEPKQISETHNENYAVWLGVTQSEDADETIGALNGEQVDWLVVDNYGIDVEWEHRLRPHTKNLMVIDDLANRHHDCDVLLDQNYSIDDEQRYAGLIPTACNLLIGPKYALLRPEYLAFRKLRRVRDGSVKRVLVFFGGSDPQNMTGMALDALSHPDLRHLEVDVVIGANNPHRMNIEQQIINRPLINLYPHRPHLADLMMKADLALGAGGTTTSERLCMGVPSLVIGIAKNQIPSCNSLHSQGLINYLGYMTEVDMDRVTKEIIRMIASPKLLVEASLAGQALVDGSGIDIINKTLGNR